ncbi:integrase arm-type DNA-binding domain-containing protein [Massilia sp. PAMC28688]|uniref:tyrosine-type recombinase/integrase n=1 Tax=Massilia sp. PAMC28688 TaxID=2861283 RepID=UPI001C625499|nr:integrase arm-type DNA-binding domain-containing protein [Massilia sp. PAMC28688]QYF95758.1 integrase arm-type DNA-binding domain-containing protein [Massilia sp. PAMC28688]
MPRLATPLTDTQVKAAKPREKTYTLADGGGMYLEVAPTGLKVWRMAYRQADGKSNRVTFGSYPAVSLSDARERRALARKQRAEGIDPAAAKRQLKQAAVAAEFHSFESVARDWLRKTAADRAQTTQDKNTAWLEKNVFPVIGGMPIADISPRDVLRALHVVEARGAIESAHKIKQLCGQVLRFGVANGLTQRDVTADLGDALSAIPQRHYAAITEPKDASRLLKAIYTYDGHPYCVAALRLAPLVFQRPGELRSMEWAEVDLENAEWRIPGTKMKMRQDHVVPLATQAVAILRTVEPMTSHGKYVFPSIRSDDRCMSENTINAALRNLGYTKEMMTGHGFRAMARTIMDEVLNERVDLIEHQLAHAVKDPNGRAYNRTKHLPARHKMMQRWADYLDSLRLGT